MLPAAQFDALHAAAKARPTAGNAAKYLSEIAGLLSELLPRLEVLIQAAADQGPEPLDAASRQLLEAGGKRIRPITTILSARVCGGDGQRALPIAAAVELVHSATLLHDDVIDEGEERRGRQASRVLWGNLVSVLSGDLLLTSALELVDGAGIPGAMRDMLATMQALIAGEVAQLKARGRNDLGIEGYLEIARGKTASLFSMACRGGARSADAPEAHIDAIGRFGERVGIAFQIVDDVLDLEGIPHEVGKRLGADLAEGKTTLPMALALEEDPEGLNSLLINARAGDPVAASRVAQAPAVRRACEKARVFAAEQTEQGLRELDALPESREKTLLAGLVRDLIERRV